MHIDSWMAYGMRVPGWILARPEISLEAKVLYAYLLHEFEHSVRAGDPVLDRGCIKKSIVWKCFDLDAALTVLVRCKLVTTYTDRDRECFKLHEHDWISACFSE